MTHFSLIHRLLSPFRHFSLLHRRNIAVTSVSQSNAHDEFIICKASDSENVWSKRFNVRNFHPKSLPQVNYDEILNGEVEDFSSDCWLDGHIHRFADANNIHHVLFDEHDYFSSPEDSSSDPVSFGSSCSDSSSPLIGNSRRNNFIELSSTILLDPPPYSDEPPPSYEEAISSFTDMQDLQHEGSGSDWLW